MIRITDMTLRYLEPDGKNSDEIREFCRLLFTLELDFFELSEPVCQLVAPLPENKKFILSVGHPADTLKYPEFGRFSCRLGGHTPECNTVTEIQTNDMREIHNLRQYSGLQNVRITGLDDILCYDYKSIFQLIRTNVKGRIQLCPQNSYGSATAIAVEWVLNGGDDIAVSFAGIGGFAPLEEVLMALRLSKRYKPNMDLSVFSRLKTLYGKITGEEVDRYKAVIGEDIFAVEAGIHADGISKLPKLYEPFAPETVGNRRKLITGKYSGKSAIDMKLKEFGLSLNKDELGTLLKAVQSKSIENRSSLSDQEFISLYHTVKASEPAGLGAS